MNEKKPSDEEQIEDSFNEDFDFGEGENETPAIQTTTSTGFNKKLISGIFIVVFAVILIMGYRIFSSPASHKSVSLKPAPITAQHTPSLNESENLPSPTISTSKANPPPAQPANKEDSIDELQKELFALEQPETQPHAAAPTLLTASTPPTTPPSSLASPAIATSGAPIETEVSQLTQNLNKLNQQIDHITNQIKYLDSYSQEVSQNLNKLNDAISSMDNRLSALSNTTSTLSKDVGSVKNDVGRFKQVLKEDGLDINLGTLSESKQSKPREGKESTIMIEEPEYTVHAVIPGRAWLKSLSGQIITVAEGDAIGNYGKILVIDAANGVVLTSSGIAFR